MDRTKWVCRKFKEVSTVIGGSTPKTDKSEYWGGSHYWVTPAELDGSKYISKTERSLTDKAVSETNLTLLPTGTVLLSSRAPIGKVCITQSPMYCNQGFKNIVCSDLLYNEFVYYYLLHNVDYLQSLGTGATFKEISKKVVENVEIIVPSLSDQHTIVAEFDKLNDVIALKRKQLADLDSLAQSLFYEMFGDPVANEKGWTTKDLKEVGKITTGNTPSKAVAEYYNNSYIEWIKTDNIEQDSPIATAAKEFLSEEGCKRGRVVDEGSLLVACIAGSVESIGKSCITNRRVAFNQQINAITPNESTNIVFLYHLVRSMKKVIQDYATTGMKHILTKSAMEGITIPLPPLLLQQSFAAKITKIEAEKQRVKSSLKDLETLLASRMQYWFDN